MTIAIGEQALASDINAEFDKRKIVRKTADETVNNSVVLQNDDHLFFAVAANEIWQFTLLLITSSPTDTPDVKIKFALPAGASAFFYALHADGTGTLTQLKATDASEIVIEATISAFMRCNIEVIATIGVNAGNIQLQWAQQVATIEDTKVKQNSCIIAHKLA